MLKFDSFRVSDVVKGREFYRNGQCFKGKVGVICGLLQESGTLEMLDYASNRNSSEIYQMPFFLYIAKADYERQLYSVCQRREVENIMLKARNLYLEAEKVKASHQSIKEDAIDRLYTDLLEKEKTHGGKSMIDKTEISVTMFL